MSENIDTNEEIETIIENNNNIYNAAQNLNLIFSVLTFTIIIIFLYRFLKENFKLKK